MSVISGIRAAIAAAHDEIETTRYAVAIMNGGITTSDYLTSLVQLNAIHTALESVVDTTSAAAFFDDQMIRSTAIERDLAYWQVDGSSIDLLSETEAVVALIRHSAQHDPLALIGMIYVLEGSRIGSFVIASPLAKALGVLPVDGQGLDYHTEGAQQVRGRLAAWKERVEQAGFDDTEVQSITSGAVRLMDALTDLYKALPAPGAGTRRRGKSREAVAV